MPPNNQDNLMEKQMLKDIYYQLPKLIIKSQTVTNIKTVKN